MMLNIKTAKNNKLNLGGTLLISLSFIFIFIGLFIYLEIIELNFCNLNKYLKNNIAERAKENIMEKSFYEFFNEFDELSEEEIKDGQTIEFVPGYFIHSEN